MFAQKRRRGGPGAAAGGAAAAAAAAAADAAATSSHPPSSAPESCTIHLHSGRVPFNSPLASRGPRRGTCFGSAIAAREPGDPRSLERTRGGRSEERSFGRRKAIEDSPLCTPADANSFHRFAPAAESGVCHGFCHHHPRHRRSFVAVTIHPRAPASPLAACTQ